ncbi:high affinity cAMP-specific and IBMX-insensitive 3',5'-cyclic phosphodiesterase 8B-like isoform X2 [Lytechinus variegatus]|uniref:high affinity cAMP-specific and IBMX-insensitive 3',5'-cyclic phosphodiesterase 8B-like isoform X2 n=1 Tax=Lytechinus variegatus TaxID=7654 RepID=UPI001BB10264|nr:high affinity cAMP-specific and IBMX-insensitive 3',5'-cyclic phosphodiesterase 8B-like isoform X2 [Lytechinus variegatus]
MGCAPSITVSQSGVVYCRDSDESNSPRPSSFGVQQHLQVRTAGGSGGADAGLEVTSSSSTTGGGGTISMIHGRMDRRGTISIEAETQTSRSTVTMKGSANQVTLGPMRLSHPTMQIMLVFAKEDAQSDGFWWAADKGGYKCNIVRNPTDALECFLEKQHDVVIIDNRTTKGFNAVALCRSIRATKPSEHTIIVAVTKQNPLDKDEPSIMPLISAGFNRRYDENANTGACLNELLQIEFGEFRSQFKLKATNSLFAALENSSDAIQITSENRTVQYVNPAYERISGYTNDEVIGHEMEDMPRCDKNKVELIDGIYSQLKKGKSWEGMLYSKKRNGESIPQIVYIAPVIGYGGKVRHHVFNKRFPAQPTNGPTVFSQELQHNVDKMGQDFANGHQGLNRRQSVARIHSMTIEAPITKVINIINTAQENSPSTVVQALDRVLDILRSSELYNPAQVREDDQITTDLVGGLMAHGTYAGKRKLSGPEVALCKSAASNNSSSSPFTHLSQAPTEVLKLLEQDASWSYQILEVERITQHRPLLFTGLKVFSRFGVCNFLGISETVLRNWLQVIESNYHSSNPYHNSSHAADVLQATAYFLGKDKMQSCFETADHVAALIAAAVHDVDHPGKTNSFLCNAGSELAILYNDTAVLESHHSALAFQLTTKEDRCNIFKELDRDDFRALRHSIIDMILATEMTKHFEHLSKFVNCINKPGAREGDDSSSLSGGRSTPDTMTLSTPENRALVRRMLIKCADVANPTRPLELCKEWARRISQEYFNQTDEEKRRGLPVVMPVFDRTVCSIPKSQISFIDYFIMDMFEAWDSFADCPELMEHLQINYVYWKGEEEKEREKKMKEKENEKGDDEKE